MAMRRQRTDSAVAEVKAALETGYGRTHPKAKIDVYRYNSASIRIRIIDPEFAGHDRVDRQERVWPLIEALPEDVRSDISVLLLITPKETKESFMNREFDDPSRTWL